MPTRCASPRWWARATRHASTGWPSRSDARTRYHSDVGSRYVAGWVGEVITIGAAVGAFGSGLACLVGASRLLFALARDGVGFAALGKISPARRIPVRATATVVIGIYMVIGVTWFVLGGKPFDLFIALGTSGTLILLVAYALATLGATRLLFFAGRREVAVWEIVVPALALILIGYTLFRNTWPNPAGAAGAYPAISALWPCRWAFSGRRGVLLPCPEKAQTRVMW